MRFAPRALAVEAADGQIDDGTVKGGVVTQLCIEVQRGIAFARNLRRHAGEEIVDERAGKTHGLKIIAAAIAADDGNAHFRHDLEKTIIHGCAVTRSEERRVGKECVSTCRSRWSPYH